MKFFRWIVSLVSLSLLGFPAKIDAANVVPKNQSNAEIASKEKSNYLILKHAKELFGGNKLIHLAAHGSHSSHASHASHASHSSHYSSTGGSSTYIPPAQSSSGSSSNTDSSPIYQDKSHSQNNSLVFPSQSKSKIIKVEGIMYSKEYSLVIIGGSVYGLNDIVCGGKISSISSDKVIIQFKDKTKVYQLNDVIEERDNSVSGQ